MLQSVISRKSGAKVAFFMLTAKKGVQIFCPHRFINYFCIAKCAKPYTNTSLLSHGEASEENKKKHKIT